MDKELPNSEHFGNIITNPCPRCPQWKPIFVVMPTLSPLAAPAVVITTALVDIRDDKAGIMTTLFLLFFWHQSCNISAQPLATRRLTLNTILVVSLTAPAVVIKTTRFHKWRQSEHHDNTGFHYSSDTQVVIYRSLTCHELPCRTSPSHQRSYQRHVVDCQCGDMWLNICVQRTPT